MSSVMLVTLLTRTPEGKSTLNRVTVGPSTQPTTLANTPKSSRVPWSSAATSRSSSSVEPRRLPSPVASRSMEGSWKPSREGAGAAASILGFGLAVAFLRGLAVAAAAAASAARASSACLRPSLRVMGRAGSSAEMSRMAAVSRGSGAATGAKRSVRGAAPGTAPEAPRASYVAPRPSPVASRRWVRAPAASGSRARERRRGCSSMAKRDVTAPGRKNASGSESSAAPDALRPLWPRRMAPKSPSGIEGARAAHSASWRARTFSMKADTENPMMITPPTARPRSRMAEMMPPNSVSPTQARAAPTYPPWDTSAPYSNR